MSRSGYSYDCDGWSLIMWRGAVKSAIRGKRGQAFLKELLSALDEMENKRLIASDLEAHGEVCALGSLGMKRGIDMSELDPENYERVASIFGISRALAQEIMFENDESLWHATPEKRYAHMRTTIAGWIKADLPREP